VVTADQPKPVQLTAGNLGISARLWRAKRVWLGFVALGFVLNGQKLITTDHDVASSFHPYAIGIVLILVAWAGTFVNRTLLATPAASALSGTAVSSTRTTSMAAPQVARRIVAQARGQWRVGIVLVAVGLNAFSVNQLRLNYSSLMSGLGWLASLILLLLAVVGWPSPAVVAVDEDTAESQDGPTFRVPPHIEAAVFIALCLLAFGLRIYRLGDLTTGMHGDEGEAGMDGINILEGNHVSPFLTGWFNQPNFYYWAIAATLRVFGTGLFGLRMFSLLAGMMMFVPFYLLVRLWFGIRTAMIATLLLAVSDVTIQFSKMEQSNITTPLCLVAGMYFLFRGIRTFRKVDFVLAGYSIMLSLYFYTGGRLSPIIAFVVLAYMFVLQPVVRLLERYRAVRSERPELGATEALRQAVSANARIVRNYLGSLAIFAVASLCFASPWLIYFASHQQEMNERTTEKLIFAHDNPQRLAAQYKETHDPLYLGLRPPSVPGPFTFLPVTFAKTPVSVELRADGFWPRMLWHQLTTTLSVFSFRAEGSSFYTFTQEPVAKPIEAVLLFLGMAWSLWRWRDTRFAALSIWFWLTILIGGVLTIDAPYMARLIGLVPVMAIFAALPLNKLVAEVARACQRDTTVTVGRGVVETLPAVTTGALLGLLCYLTFENAHDYYGRYLQYYQLSDVTGQALFVQQTNKASVAQGQQAPKYFDLGAHNVYWNHGDNRFINHGADGIDMVNPSSSLPIIDNGNRDIVFLVWPQDAHYLSVIKTYYPEGQEGTFTYGAGSHTTSLFTWYRVSKEQLDARRLARVRYTPATGDPVNRLAPELGTTTPPPAELAYPVAANWTSSIVVPVYGTYHAVFDAPAGSSVTVDDVRVLTTNASSTHVETGLALARGLHAIRVSGSLATSATKITFLWSPAGESPAPVPRAILWSGSGEGLLGTIRAFSGAPLTTSATPSNAPLLMSRLDGFLGFRDSASALGGAPLEGDWSGTLTAPVTGRYEFDVFSNGDSVVFVDGHLVVNNVKGGDQPHAAPAQLDLVAGPHRYELRYVWRSNFGFLEAFWTPPNGQRSLIGPDVFRASGGVATTKVPAVVRAVQPASVLGANRWIPEQVLGASAGMVKPSGIGVDATGNVYAGDRGNHRIVVLSTSGKVLRTWGKAPASNQEKDAHPGEFGQIVDVAAMPDGTVYVMDFAAHQLQVFDSSGKLRRSLDAQTLKTSAANGIGLGVDGSVYIADSADGRILRVPSLLSAGSTVMDGSASYDGAGSHGIELLEQPVDVVVDPSAPVGAPRFFAADLRDRIVQFGPDGLLVKEWRLPVGREEGGSRLAISPDGTHLYMTDPERKRVAILDVASGAISYFGDEGTGPGQFGGPSGIAVGRDGRIYVLDRVNATVQVFRPQ
jgi:4-amino-4-deoxy-L-arabinose transferase-like glycosyltransferase/sugar lactone lactonase YvrE